MPQIPYKDTQTLVVPLANPNVIVSLPIPDSQHYLGFTLQIIDAKCDVGNPPVDGGFRVEANLGGVDSNGDPAWAVVYSADFYAPQDPHFHQGEIITFSLRAPAKNGIRVVSKSAVTAGGKVMVSMYERAYPPQV